MRYGTGTANQSGESKNVVNLHCDEFNELMGDEFIPLINKGGGAGMQVTAATGSVQNGR